MLESIAPGFLYSVAKDGLRVVGRLFRRKQPRLTPTEIIAKRQQWKAVIDEKLWERRKQKLGMDVIVRDVARINEYPDTKNGKGISAWYKCGLMGTYHRGILLGLSWKSLTAEGEDKWRYTNHKAGENGDLKVILIGYVPYESIEAIIWDGDEYYGNPHIYCHFEANQKQPYEKLVFCAKRELNEIPFYTEICPYEPVRKRSKKSGIH